MKISLVYFSATGNTAKMARAIKERCNDPGSEVDEYDVTAHADHGRPIDFQPYDACLF